MSEFIRRSGNRASAANDRLPPVAATTAKRNVAIRPRQSSPSNLPAISTPREGAGGTERHTYPTKRGRRRSASGGRKLGSKISPLIHKTKHAREG